MKVLRGTLTFVLGMIIGIILFVVAVGGSIFAVASLMTVDDLQNKLGVDFIEDGSEISDKTLWDTVTSLLDDIQNIDTLKLNTLKEKYGLPLPDAINKSEQYPEGIDISFLYDYTIVEIPDKLTDMISHFSLTDVSCLIGKDLGSYGLPILTENMDVDIQTALDTVLKSLDADNLTLRAVDQNFGFLKLKEPGQNGILDAVADVTISALSDIINYVTFGELIAADVDSFVPVGVNKVWYKPVTDDDKYVKVNSGEYGDIADGATTYVSGADTNGNLIVKELRYIKKTVNGEDIYKVDYASNADGFTPAPDSPDRYRLMQYKPYDASKTDAELFVKGISSQNAENGYIPLSTLSTDKTGAIRPAVDAEGNVGLTSFFYKFNDVYQQAEAYVPGEKGNLEPAADGATPTHYRAHNGTVSALIEAISSFTLKTIENVQSEIMNIKLGDLIEIKDTDSAFLKNNADKTLNEIIHGIDGFSLSTLMEIRVSAYVPDNAGPSVYITDAEGKNGYYTPYNPEDETHTGRQRYSVYVDATDKNAAFSEATAAEIAAGTNIYYYNQQSKTMEQYTGGSHGKLYIKGVSPAAKVLQRLANISIGSFTTSFDNLVLGDVLDISPDSNVILRKLNTVKISELGTKLEDIIMGTSIGEILSIEGDTYATADADYITAHPSERYYRLDNGLYLSASKNYRDEHPGEVFYRVSHVGSGNNLLKKMAGLNIGEMNNRLQDVINDIYISDVITIEQFTKGNSSIFNGTITDVNDESRWFIPYDPVYTEGSGVECDRYAFVHDEKGRYYRTKTLYEEAKPGELIKDGSTYYKYVSLKDSGITGKGASVLASYGALCKNNPNALYLYYKTEDGTFKYNSAITTYLLATAGRSDMVYFRTAATAGDDGAVNAPTYKNNAVLFVNLGGQLTLYSSSFFAHSDAQFFFKYSDGYYAASEEMLNAGVETYYYNFSTGNYQVAYDTSTCASTKFIQIPKADDGTYYYSPLDNSDASKNGNKYSKVSCETVYVDGTPSIGYVAYTYENAVWNGASYGQFISNKKLEITTSKSDDILAALAAADAPLVELPVVVQNLKLKDVMPIGENSIFKDFENETINTLDAAISGKMATMTVGDVLLWGNVTGVDGKIVALLQDAPIANLFRALELDATTGTITINPLKLLGIELPEEPAK